MRALALSAVLLAGCNQLFGLDPTSLGDGGGAVDARACPQQGTAGFEDEDGDGLDDTCDDCPADVDPEQLDTDHDGVGDACDVTGTPTRIAFFDGFHTAGPVGPSWFVATGDWVVSADHLVLPDAPSAEMIWVSGLDVSVGRVVTSVTIGALPVGAVDHIVGVTFDGNDDSAYVCATDEVGTTTEGDVVIDSMQGGLVATIAGPALATDSFKEDAQVVMVGGFAPGAQACGQTFENGVLLQANDTALADGTVGFYSYGVPLGAAYVIVYEEVP